MGNWWPAKGRGLIFGLWTCHQYIGDIVAALAAGFLLHSGYDYRWYCLEYLMQFNISVLQNGEPHDNLHGEDFQLILCGFY
jgi:sugar phosphate permease